MNIEIIELETKIAFLEKHLSELSDVIYKQQKQIDQLNLNLQQIEDKFLATSAENGSSISVHDEKPPHY